MLFVCFPSEISSSLLFLWHSRLNTYYYYSLPSEFANLTCKSLIYIMTLYVLINKLSRADNIKGNQDNIYLSYAEMKSQQCNLLLNKNLHS